MRPRPIVALIAGGLAAGACAQEPERLPAGAPIVVVVVDTLRADGLGLYGNPRATSESLDRWAASGAVFERAFSTAPWTLPSVASLLTGCYPATHGSGRRVLRGPDGSDKTEYLPLDAATPRLASRLSSAGYASAAFITNSFLAPRFGLEDGFDRYEFGPSRKRDERRADVMVDQALAWIDGQEPGEPWFLLLHLLDPHQPYDPPQDVAGRFTAGYRGALVAPFEAKPPWIARVNGGQLRLDEADRAFLRGIYDEEVTFTAGELARFLEGLATRQVLERGLVLVTADHGEEFLDHGGFEHGHTMYQELLRIPFVVWGRDVRAGRCSEPVSLVDVLPTVLEATGLPLPEGLDGVSLWPILTGGGALAPRQLLAQNSLYGDQRGALVEWPYKLIANLEHGRFELYDLERDPGEREDLAPSRPDLAERLVKALRVRAEPASEREAVHLDAEMEAELRKLGYLGEDERDEVRDERDEKR